MLGVLKRGSAKVPNPVAVTCRLVACPAPQEEDRQGDDRGDVTQASDSALEERLRSSQEASSSGNSASDRYVP